MFSTKAIENVLQTQVTVYRSGVANLSMFVSLIDNYNDIKSQNIIIIITD